MMKKKLKNKRKKIKTDDNDDDDGELDESILDAVNEYVENLEDNDNNDNNNDDDNNNTIDNKKGKKIDKNARNSKIIGILSSSSSSSSLLISSLLLIGNIEVTVLDDRMNPLSLYKCSKAANDFAKSIITNKERIKHSTYQSKKRGIPAFR